MNLTKEGLLSYFDNKIVYDLVFKVLNFNFQNEVKTTECMSLIRDYLCDKTISTNEIKMYLANNELGLSKEAEIERVNSKIVELCDIIKSEINEKPTSLLDIGVGNGNIITSLGKELGINQNNLFGIDVVDYSNNNNFNYINYQNGRIPLPDNSIDCAFIMMVLHHDENPSAILKEAHRIIKKGGSVIVRETNAYSPELAYFNILMEYIFYYIILDIPVEITHNYFSDELWEVYFREAGFNFKKVQEKPFKENIFTAMYYVLTKEK